MERAGQKARPTHRACGRTIQLVKPHSPNVLSSSRYWSSLQLLLIGWPLEDILEDALQPEHGAPLLGVREDGGPVVLDYEEPVPGVVGCPHPPSPLPQCGLLLLALAWPTRCFQAPLHIPVTCLCPTWGGQ